LSSTQAVGDGVYEVVNEYADAATSFADSYAVADEPSANGSSATSSTNADKKRKAEAFLPLGEI